MPIRVKNKKEEERLEKLDLKKKKIYLNINLKDYFISLCTFLFRINSLFGYLV
jgi:hypothetical protein